MNGDSIEPLDSVNGKLGDELMARQVVCPNRLHYYY